MKIAILACVFWILGAAVARADLALRADARSLALSEALAIDGASEWARRPINIDGVVAAMVEGVLGDPAKNPKAGDTLPVPSALMKEVEPASVEWKEVKGEVKGEGASASGVFPGGMPRGTYLLFAVTSERERVMMLEASGHGAAYVNGEPRVGDPYSIGSVRLPILLREGANQIVLQHANRGELKARLEAPRGRVEINENDLTLPDVIVSAEYDFAAPLINCTTGHLHVLLRASERTPDRPEWRAAVSLPPLSVTKVPMRVALLAQEAIPSVASVIVDIAHANGSHERLASSDIVFASRDAAHTHKRTYVSAIDGSVQYVSIVPSLAEEGADAGVRPGMVLSLHGASVEATNQAASYAPKKGLVIACPTNRRPYGFDWEDWGRLDALEAMDFVAREFKTDPQRQYLTGHSMGGHGTWQLGCLYPQRFAAIAPSAGWLSFDTYMSAVGQKYGPAGDDPVMRKFREVIWSSDTLGLLPRLQRKEGTPPSIYILHGDTDDNVPVSEARRAREELTRLAIPFEFHEQPGAGHWWDDDSVKKAHIGADSDTKWGTACVDWPAMFEMFRARSGTAWRPDDDSAPFTWLGNDQLHPGSFKRVFNNRFVLVYGTQGSDAENAWSYAKARYDAEQWWYRGNGHARILSDEVFRANAQDGLSENAVFYGSATTNSAVRATLLYSEDLRNISESPANIRDRALLLTSNSRVWGTNHTIAIIGGSSLRAMRATDRLSYFSAGVDYPAVTILSPDIWARGEGDVLAAATPDGSGSINHAALVWRDLAAHADALPARMMERRVPDWAKGAVWYQVFPERFRNGNTANDPQGAGVFLAPWNSNWYGVQPGELEAMLARRGIDKPNYKPHRAGALYDVIYDRRYGGDLQGIEQKLDYLKDLGVTAIYLNPIFQARSLHKYDVTDYRHIDEALGASGPSQPIDAGYYRPQLRPDGAHETDDPATWVWTDADTYFIKTFLPACKSRGIRLILDGCFNHTGLEFWAFQDIRKNGRKSPYASWYQCEFDNAGNLASWVGWPGNKNGYLPEFRQVWGQGRQWDATVEFGTLNAGVKKHIFDITRRWMDPNADGDPSDGIDGWRLDVAGEIAPKFWDEWRSLVKSINPEALIVAEVWSKVMGLGAESGFDTQMNYPFAYPVLDWLRNMDEHGQPVSSRDLGERLNAAFAGDAPSTQLIHQNLFASHDTDRYVNMLWNPGRGYDKDCAEQNLDDRENLGTTQSKPYKPGKPPEDIYKLSVLGVAIQSMYTGSPMIYYGDEVGMWGSDDPTCRKPRRWEDQFASVVAPAGEDERPMSWLREEYKKWLTLRQHPQIGPVLRLGSVRHLDSGSDDAFAFEREHDGVRVVVVVNRGGTPFEAGALVPGGAREVDEAHSTTVPGISAMWWKI